MTSLFNVHNMIVLYNILKPQRKTVLQNDKPALLFMKVFSLVAFDVDVAFVNLGF